jgi:hypothetical protein
MKELHRGFPTEALFYSNRLECPTETYGQGLDLFFEMLDYIWQLPIPPLSGTKMRELGCKTM